MFIQSAPKFTSDHLKFKNIFRGLYPRIPLTGKGMEMKGKSKEREGGREEKGEKGKGKETEGREGKGREEKEAVTWLAPIPNSWIRHCVR